MTLEEESRLLAETKTEVQKSINGKYQLDFYAKFNVDIFLEKYQEILNEKIKKEVLDKQK